jgi:predicted ATP-grasp superfamily ATP-dependent carboligase
MSNTPHFPGAIVVGLCAHGVGMVRSLYRAGVRVIALEANEAMPGVRTRCAEVRIVPDINGEGLLDALAKLAQDRPECSGDVLMLTNDKMVEVVGRHADTVSRYFRLSWGHAAPALLPLLAKDQIEARCKKVGLNYPTSVLLTQFDDAPTTLAQLSFPVIAKPTRPVSAFKTQVSASMEAFFGARARMETSMPLVVQEFIAGDDSAIRFGALYLDHGRVLARFEGRKLRSRPMGHTTIAVSEPDDEVHTLACRFFEGLALSGPVSLELKRDPAGSYWVIEPTVGRTDFWAGLCAANGVDLTLVEYAAVTGQPPPASTQRRTHLWVNGERDPGALFWLLRNTPRRLTTAKVQGVYLGLEDPGPFFTAMSRFLAEIPARISRRTLRTIRGSA